MGVQPPLAREELHINNKKKYTFPKKLSIDFYVKLGNIHQALTRYGSNPASLIYKEDELMNL